MPDDAGAGQGRRTRRGSEELWLDAAHAALVEGGVEAVKVMPLARALGVSRTSFYWHFEDREALLDALLRQWRAKNTGNLAERAGRYSETICEAMFNLFDCWIDPALFDARLDAAVRDWARWAPQASAAMAAADDERIEALTAMFRRHGYGDEEAGTRARTVYYTQVGYISMQVAEPLEARMKRMPAYVETFTGRRPTKAEIARFRARQAETGLEAAEA